MDDHNFERLIDYFAGTLEPMEAAELEAWIAADPRRAEEVATLQRIWSASGQLPERYDSTAAWNRIAAELGRATTAAGRAAPVRAPRAAATATYTPPRRWARWAKAAAIVIALGGGSAALLESPVGARVLDRPVPLEEWAEHRTERGQRLRLRLADGSEVLLGPDSRLLRPPRFQRRARELRLEGNAHFTVRAQAGRPFRVYAGGGVTEVLGTSFTVRAYPDEADVRVAVQEGRVAIRTLGDVRDAVPVILRAGEVGTMPEDGPARSLEDVEADRYLAWTDGKLVFDRTLVAEVLREIERWYGVEIRSEDPALARTRLTISFGAEPLTSVLAVISAALDVPHVREGNVVILGPTTR